MNHGRKGSLPTQAIFADMTVAEIVAANADHSIVVYRLHYRQAKTFAYPITRRRD
jgi:hypothetical protein